MAHVKEGMPEKEVIAWLGRPDDIRTQYDPDGIPTNGTREVWGYGTNGHLTFPTLGCIYVDTNGRAQYVYGDAPPGPQTFREEELRRLLRLIDTLPGYTSGWDYNPLPVIQVVNSLLPLGKDKALAVMEEYLRVCSGWWPGSAEGGLFLVLRVLFEVPADPGYMPPMYVGAISPEAPKDPKRLPHYPLVVVDDIPLSLVASYFLGGEAERVESHLKYFREHGRLRTKPLTPPADPLAVFDRAWASVSFMFPEKQAAWGKLLLMNQFLRLVDSVYRRKTDVDGLKFRTDGDPDPGWRKIAGDLRKLGIRWNVDKARYTLKDGTFLPEPPRKLYRRVIWHPDGLGGTASLILQRRDERYLDVSFSWEGVKKDRPEAIRLQVFAAKDPSKPIAELSGSSLEAGANDKVT